MPASCVWVVQIQIIHDTNDANAVERAVVLMKTIFATFTFTMSLFLPQILIKLRASDWARLRLCVVPVFRHKFKAWLLWCTVCHRMPHPIVLTDRGPSGQRCYERAIVSPTVLQGLG